MYSKNELSSFKIGGFRVILIRQPVIILRKNINNSIIMGFRYRAWVAILFAITCRI